MVFSFLRHGDGSFDLNFSQKNRPRIGNVFRCSMPDGCQNVS